MKKTVSIIYALVVIVALVCVLIFFGLKAYRSRSARIANFITSIDDHTHRLAEAMKEEQDAEKGVSVAEEIMENDLSLTAVQVISRADGLQLSVVKGVAADFSQAPLSESNRFNRWPAKLRYHLISRPLPSSDMADQEVYYLLVALSSAELRGGLLIILIVVLGLFVTTLVVMLLPSRRSIEKEKADGESREDFSIPDGFSPASSENSQNSGYTDFDRPDRLDRSDLMGSSMDVSESFADDFELPDLDDVPTGPSTSHEGLISRLELELERAASFNQDLVFILFSSKREFEEAIREAYAYKDLVFSMENETTAVIDINKDLDSALSVTEEFFQEHRGALGIKNMRVGLASRNGRLISAERLYNEAENALRKTDTETNIVAFRSDPEKYRSYLKKQEN